MDQAIRIIRALVAILRSENTYFKDLNTQGASNVSTILTQCELFVRNYEAEQEAARRQEQAEAEQERAAEEALIELEEENND